MRQFLRFSYLFCCILISACTSAKSETTALQIPPLESAEVERVYGLYQQGQYAAYVAEMASCDNTPEDYLNGYDRQLVRAVEEMMKVVKK